MSHFERLRKLVTEFDRVDPARWADSAFALLFPQANAAEQRENQCPLLAAALEIGLPELVQFLKKPAWKSAAERIDNSLYGIDSAQSSPLSARVAVIQAAASNGSSGAVKDWLKQSLAAYQANWGDGAVAGRPLSITDDGIGPAWRQKMDRRRRELLDELAGDVPGGYANPALHLAGSAFAALCDQDRPALSHQVHTWVLFAAGSTAGFPDGLVGRLTMSRVAGGHGFVYPDTRGCGYLRLAPCFGTGIGRALAAACFRALPGTVDYDICWNLHLPISNRPPNWPVLQGQSGEAAFACAFRAIHDGVPLDENVAISASLQEPDHLSRLNPVGALPDKILAVLLGRQVNELLVSDQQEEAGHDFDNGKLRVVGVRDMAAAYENLSRWPRLSRKVKQAVAANAKARLRERCDGPYIPSDLRRRKKEPDRQRIEKDDDRYEPEPLSKPQRRAMFAGRGPNRIRLFADSGTGKTTLLMYWEHLLATADNDLIPVRLDNLSAIPWLPKESLLSYLADHFATELKSESDPAHVVSSPIRRSTESKETLGEWLKTMLDRGKLVFLLDALDQTTELGPFKQWLNTSVGDCRVVITGRQHTESGQRGDVFHGDWETLRVDLFTEQQQRRFLRDRGLIEKLLPDRNDSRKEKQKKEHWQPLLGVPLLLRLMRDLARDGELDGLTNREQVYRRALLDHEAAFDVRHREATGLVGKGLSTLRGRGFDDAVTVDDIEHFLASFAFSAVQRGGFTGRIAESVQGAEFKQTQTILKRDLCDSGEQIELRQLLQILTQVNVLTKNALVDRSEGFSWRHLSFCEYFVGVHLAVYLGAEKTPEERHTKLREVIENTHDVEKAYSEARKAMSSTAVTHADDQTEIPPREQWQWVFRFALSRAQAQGDQSTLNELARLLIAHGNPYVVWTAIEEDGIALEPRWERLCRWLVHWTWKDRDYSEVWSDGDDRVPVELFDAATFGPMFQRRFRNSPSLAAAWPILDGASSEFAAAQSIRKEFLGEVDDLRTDATLRPYLDSFQPCPPQASDSLEFEMGESPGDEEAEEDEKPRHRVRVRDRFAMAEFPVTNAEYEWFDPSHFWHRDEYSRGDDQPALYVSWHMARLFGIWLSGADEPQPYRLPTEAEWEFACRAGSATKFWWSDEFDGRRCHNYESRAEERTLGRGESTELHRNGWGLQHMSGNVWEWCEDWYEGYWYQQRVAESSKRKGKRSPSCDDIGPSAGSFRVLRGGSFDGYVAKFCRSSDRYFNQPSFLDGGIGFRLVGVVRLSRSS